MPQVFTCPRGHRWEAKEAGTAGKATQASVCPQCGAADTRPARPVRTIEAATTDSWALAPDDIPTQPPSGGQPITTGEDGHAHASPELPAVPGYEVLGVLGRGGMGVVYKARQRDLKRLVALKMILAGAHAGPRELARFQVEAEAVARLQHPNIVQIHEIGMSGGLPYFSLEYVSGGSLAAKLAGTPWPARKAAGLVETLAWAIHHAHERDVIHRDLKPANVLLTKQGEPKVTDFGLAKRLEQQGTPATRTGAVMGTPSYMAPEQADGKTKELRPAADVYALGAILYEILTGRPPFKAATDLDTIIQVIADEPIPPRRFQPKLNRDLETICLKCLSKKPADRYASADLLAEDLRRFLDGEPIRARRLNILGRARRWSRKYPVFSLLLVLIVFGTGVGIYQSMQTMQLFDQAKNNLPSAFSPPPPRRPLTQPPAFKITSPLLSYRGRVTALVYNRKGTRLATARQDGEVRVWEVATGKVDHILTGHHDAVTALSFSPAGDRLASVGLDGTVRVWDCRTGKVVVVHQDTCRRLLCVTFCIGGKCLAYGGADGLVKIVDADKCTLVRTLHGHKDYIVGIACDRDGATLATAGWDGTVRLWDAARGEPLFTFNKHAGRVTCVAFSPSADLVASGGANGEVLVWQARTGTVMHRLAGHTAEITSLAFSPSGNELASAGWDHTLRMWGGQSQILLDSPHGGPITSVAFRSDGHQLAVTGWDGGIQLMKLPLDQPAKVPTKAPRSTTAK